MFHPFPTSTFSIPLAMMTSPVDFENFLAMFAIPSRMGEAIYHNVFDANLEKGSSIHADHHWRSCGTNVDNAKRFN